MNTKLIAGTALAGLIFIGSAVGIASAQSTTETETAAPAAPTLTMQDAIDKAILEVPGTVQEAELENEDGKQFYEIEIVNAEGTEMEVAIDATSGDVIEVEEGDKDCDGDRKGKKGKKGKKGGDRGERGDRAEHGERGDANDDASDA